MFKNPIIIDENNHPSGHFAFYKNISTVSDFLRKAHTALEKQKQTNTPKILCWKLPEHMRGNGLLEALQNESETGSFVLTDSKILTKFAPQRNFHTDQFSQSVLPDKLLSGGTYHISQTIEGPRGTSLYVANTSFPSNMKAAFYNAINHPKLGQDSNITERNPVFQDYSQHFDGPYELAEGYAVLIIPATIAPVIRRVTDDFNGITTVHGNPHDTDPAARRRTLIATIKGTGPAPS